MWGDWNSRNRWLFDYRLRVKALTVSHLVIGGTVDTIAPAANCAAHFAFAGAPDKELKLLGIAHGQHADYGHGDLVLGTRVATEMYPHLISWLGARATLR